MITIDSQKIEAVIFDMDGTMVDNAAAHKKAWELFCIKYNIPFGPKTFKTKISGKKNDTILETLFNKKMTVEEIKQMGGEKEKMYRELYRNQIKEVPGLRNLLDKLKQKQMKLAIATTAPEKNRQMVLDILHLDSYFTVICGDETVTRGKPDPEIYIKACQELNVDPSRIIAFEDSSPGIESAKRAELTVYGVLTRHTPEELHMADSTIKNFTEVQII